MQLADPEWPAESSKYRILQYDSDPAVIPAGADLRRCADQTQKIICMRIYGSIVLQHSSCDQCTLLWGAVSGNGRYGAAGSSRMWSQHSHRNGAGEKIQQTQRENSEAISCTICTRVENKNTHIYHCASFLAKTIFSVDWVAKAQYLDK